MNGAPRRSAGFTLTELLVAIAVIAVLGTLTVFSIRGISRDARMSSGRNTVTAVLDNARALAMRDNQVVVVVFRSRFVGEKEMAVEATTAAWSGQSYGNSNVGVIDRFVPLPDVDPKRLPEGVKVAGPRYGENLDDRWSTQPHLPAIDQGSPVGAPNERPGALLGVMYGPDGTTLSRNSQSDSNRTWVDFNVHPDPTVPPTIRSRSTDYNPSANAVNNGFFDYLVEDDEPFVEIIPFLTVYDDAEARESKSLDWSNDADYQAELAGAAGYIATYGRRIHFNRYTGVVMTTKDRS